MTSKEEHISEEAKQRAKNYMSLKGALDSQYVDFSNPNADKITSASTTNIKEEPKQIKCYCGHTTYCDCVPLEEPKQETHICKWCKAETWQSDDECYAKQEIETTPNKTNMKQQTAVEWLVKQYEKAYTLKINNVMTSIIEKAKAMEKEQMGKFANDYADQVMAGMMKRAEDYYNENFKSEYTSGPTMEEFIDNRKEKLETLARLLAKSWFYMDWKWENPNERVMQMLMQELGLYPFKDEDEMIQQTQVDENLYKQASKEIKGYNKQSIDFELRIPPEPTYTNLTLDFEVRSSACETEDCPHCVYERQQEYEAELEKDACIDFAKWLAQSDWMSIWVKDKWMWECQLENSKMGYKTEEELYQIYLKEN